jgi:hypothetical protein
MNSKKNHKNIYTLLFAIFMLCGLGTSCNAKTPTQKPFKKSFFNGTINRQPWKGDGIAFSRDNVLHIRGLSGSYGFMNQIDIVINKTDSVTHKTGLKNASLSEVIGQDMVRQTYESQGKASDYISYFWNKNESYVVGKFNFYGVAQNGKSAALVEGTFKIKVGRQGEKSWGCGFLKRIPTKEGCDFLKNTRKVKL